MGARALGLERPSGLNFYTAVVRVVGGYLIIAA